MEDKSVLRWGGLAGMLGGIVFIFVPVILFGFVPPAPASPAELVARFPTVRAAIAGGGGGGFFGLRSRLAGVGPFFCPFLRFRGQWPRPPAFRRAPVHPRPRSH